MKRITLIGLALILLALPGCNGGETPPAASPPISQPPQDQPTPAQPPEQPGNNQPPAGTPAETPEPAKEDGKVYANERFRNVQVQKIAADTYKVTGQAQVFEAAFSYVVEDGHYELLQGHDMTDAGAPAFGNFSFTFTVKKERPNSTLTLVLFEASPKDGSRQYELPVPLPE